MQQRLTRKIPKKSLHPKGSSGHEHRPPGGGEKSGLPYCNPFLLFQPRQANGPLIPASPQVQMGPLPKFLYGVLDQAEVSDDGNTWLMFGTVAGEWLQRQLAQSTVIPADLAARTQFFASMPLYLLEIRLSPVEVLAVGGPDGSSFSSLGPASRHPFGQTLIDLERRWIRIDLAGAGRDADLFDNLFGPAIQVAVGSIRPALPDEGQFLDSLDPLQNEPDATEQEIEDALSAVSHVDEVAVYDVGQGGANGLVSAKEVVCYFDFGGGVAGNTPTFPTALSTFCQCLKPPIILSHWDHDHWSSEGRDKRVHAHTWIVPRQTSHNTKKAPHHSALITAIQSAHGTIVVWPSTLSTKRIGQLEIGQCTGSSKNDSGLCLEIHPPSGVFAKPVLMPADAGYDDLAVYRGSGSYDAIVCPHHGGRSNSPRIPSPPSSGTYQRLIYTYGINNTYKHPLLNTYTNHNNAFWLDRRVTVPPANYIARNTADRNARSGLGHVGFDWTTSTSLTALTCAAGSDLDVQQK